MDDSLKSYLADQSAAISSSDEDDPQSRPDPALTDHDDDVEMPDDEESPGDETEDEDDAEASDGSAEPAEGVDPRLLEIERRALAAEQRALELQNQIAVAHNQIAVDREYARLQARWAQMDPEDAEVERRQMVQAMASERTQALHDENLTLRQQIEQHRDLVEHKPRAIQFLAESYQLNPAERKQLERINDPLVMKVMAEGFADARKEAQRDARRAAKEQRLSGGQDRIGTTNGRAASTPAKSSGNALLDYNRQQADLRP